MKKVICNICGAECNGLFTQLDLNNRLEQNEIAFLSHTLPIHTMGIERDNKQMDLCAKCSHYIEQKIEEMREVKND